MKFKIELQETNYKMVEVEADTIEHAISEVDEMYCNIDKHATLMTDKFVKTLFPKM